MSVVVEIDLAQGVVTLRDHVDEDGNEIRIMETDDGQLGVVSGRFSRETVPALSDALEIARRVL